MKKNAKKCKKICIYQKKAVPLHRHLKKTPKVNPIRKPKKTKIMITKTKIENGYTYKTNHYTRNDKRDFKYALLQVLKEGKIGIIKLANSESQMRAHVNRWWYSHAIAVEIESGRILWEKKRV